VKQGRQRGKDRPTDGEQSSERELVEKQVFLNRVAKVVKGGRRFSFSALVAVGDKSGSVGLGMGKANEVPEAFRKAVAKAKKNMRKVFIQNGTIPFQVMGHFGAGKVMMKPASRGTGVIAGGAVRAIMEVAGVRDILTKSLGTSNQMNMALATMDGLNQLMDPEEITNRRQAGE